MPYSSSTSFWKTSSVWASRKWSVRPCEPVNSLRRDSASSFLRSLLDSLPMLLAALFVSAIVAASFHLFGS